jgi:hypothetical protein
MNDPVEYLTNLLKKALNSTKTHGWDCALAGKASDDLSWCTCWIKDAKAVLGESVPPPSKYLQKESNGKPMENQACGYCRHPAKDHAQLVNLCCKVNCDCEKFSY